MVPLRWVCLKFLLLLWDISIFLDNRSQTDLNAYSGQFLVSSRDACKSWGNSRKATAKHICSAPYPTDNQVKLARNPGASQSYRGRPFPSVQSERLLHLLSSLHVMFCYDRHLKGADQAIVRQQADWKSTSLPCIRNLPCSNHQTEWLSKS